MDYTGFVYIWFDRKRKIYCVGSHFGSLDDGYITSTGTMPRAYKKRPEDFKRRVLKFYYGYNRKELHALEQYYLDMIKIEELYSSESLTNGKCRYYNMKKSASGLSGEVASQLRKDYFQTEAGMNRRKELSKQFTENNPSIPGREPWNKGKKCPEHSEFVKQWYIDNPVTDEKREEQRKRTKQMWEEGVYDNRPLPTKETIQKRIDTNKANGFKQTDHQKQRAKEANQNSYRILWKSGKIEEFTGLGDFCDRHSIPRPTVMWCMGNNKPSKKWGFIKIEKID